MSFVSSRPPRLRLPDQVTVDFGPPDVLAATFLSVDRAVRDHGIYLSINHDLGELVEVNEQNRKDWSPLLPMFDPSLGGTSPENSFWISGVNDSGEVVLCHAARLYLWPETSLADELETLRFFYPQPEIQKKANERCLVVSDAASTISGRVCYSGAVWVRPDYRGRGLAHLTPRLVRAYSLTRWYPDFSVGMVQMRNVTGHKAAETYGWRHMDTGIHWFGSGHGPEELKVAFGWLEREEVVEDLQQYTSLLRDPVNAAVV
jgi:GNAT superfamily N-acetyltransferase